MGEINYRADAPMFDEEWESRIMALALATAIGNRKGSLREGIETIPAKDFLQMSSYERWYAGLIRWGVSVGLLTDEEVVSGRSNGVPPGAGPAMTPEFARNVLFRSFQSQLDLDIGPGFQVGDRVRVRNEHKRGHTRRPGYTRGKVAVVQRDNGIFNLPDNEVYGLDPRPQHTYQVRFTAQELWGDTAPGNDSLNIDMWEDYLEPA